MIALPTLALWLAVSTPGQVPGVGETVLLDFTADWCGPCKSVKPLVHQLATAGYPVREVNIDRERSLAAKYHITSIPCFVMLVNGQEVDRQLGATSYERLKQMLDRRQSIAVPTQRVAAPLAATNSGRGATLASHEVPVETTVRGQSPDSGDELVQASVRLKVEDQDGNSYGTGTIIDARDDEALVLTCGHIFRDSAGKGKIMVDLFDGSAPRSVPGHLISYDLKRDLGLVSIRPGKVVKVARVAPKDRPIAVGDKVSSVGCNNGQDPSLRRSRVTGVDKYLGPANLEVAGLPVEGRSGGGLFNVEGQLIGICFAADPTDDEGVYAHLSSIHAELDRLGLAKLCAPAAVDQDSSGGKLVSVNPPNMPRQMPKDNSTTLASAPAKSAAAAPAELANSAGVRPLETAAHAPASAPTGAAPRQLSAAEQATLTELASRLQDSEVICIVRPLSDPQAKSEVIVLDRASAQFVDQLSRRGQGAQRRLTSLEVPRTAAVPGNSKAAEVSGDDHLWRGKR